MGWGVIQSLGVFIVSVLLALGLYLALVYLPLMMWRAKQSPFTVFKGLSGAMTIAFSTTSTATPAAHYSKVQLLFFWPISTVCRWQ